LKKSDLGLLSESGSILGEAAGAAAEAGSAICKGYSEGLETDEDGFPIGIE